MIDSRPVTGALTVDSMLARQATGTAIRHTASESMAGDQKMLDSRTPRCVRKGNSVTITSRTRSVTALAACAAAAFAVLFAATPAHAQGTTPLVPVAGNAAV